MRHTPGPWTIGSTQLGKISGVLKAGHGQICSPPYGNGDAMRAWNANARLIAAAPELLESLREVTKWLGNVRFGEKGYTYDGVLIDMNEGAHKRLLEKSRAAINKARGE